MEVFKKRKKEHTISREEAYSIAKRQPPLDKMLQDYADEYNSYMNLGELKSHDDLVSLKNTKSLVEGHRFYLVSKRPFSEYDEKEQEEIVSALSSLHDGQLRNKKTEITRTILYIPESLEDVAEQSADAWRSEWRKTVSSFPFRGRKYKSMESITTSEIFVEFY